MKRNQPTPSSPEAVLRAMRRSEAHRVLKTWCAYYDPNKVVWGNESKCKTCCRMGITGFYDPAMMHPPGDGSDGSCKHAHIIEGCLPEPTK